jgi:hypothetical protein
MEYSTLKPWQEIGEAGIVPVADSVYGRMRHVADPRGAKGKRYSLVMLVTVILLAKLAGKALRVTRIAGQERNDHVLSIYEVQDQCVLAQQTVETKENEIVAAPRVLERVLLAGKIVTGDAMHMQKAVSEQIVKGEGDYL